MKLFLQYTGLAGSYTQSDIIEADAGLSAKLFDVYSLTIVIHIFLAYGYFIDIECAICMKDC
jgi:hypothetical protein